jgi:hypothetical protein
MRRCAGIQIQKTKAHLTGAVVPSSDERRNHQNTPFPPFGFRAHLMAVLPSVFFSKKE